MTRLGSFWRRNTVAIGVVVIIMAFGTILFLQAVATAKLQQQAKQNAAIIAQIHSVTDQLGKNSAQRTQQIATLTAHIDCIVTFFSQPQSARSNTAIEDIDTCTLKNSNTGSTTTSPSSSSTAPAATTPKNNSTSSTSPAPSTTSTAPSTPEAAKPIPFLQRVIVNPIKNIINAL